MNEERKEINLRTIMRRALRFWWIILLITLIAGGISYYITTEKVVPSYQSASMLFIGKEVGSLAEITFNDIQVGNQLAMDYSQLIKTDLVTEEVINALNLSVSTIMLKKNLSIEMVEDSRFMSIAYEDTNPQMAMDIANKFTDILVEKSVGIVGVKNIKVVDYAKTPTSPISPSVIINVVLAGILGLIISILFVSLPLRSINPVQSEIQQSTV